MVVTPPPLPTLLACTDKVFLQEDAGQVQTGRPFGGGGGRSPGFQGCHDNHGPTHSRQHILDLMLCSGQEEEDLKLEETLCDSLIMVGS